MGKKSIADLSDDDQEALLLIFRRQIGEDEYKSLIKKVGKYGIVALLLMEIDDETIDTMIELGYQHLEEYKKKEKIKKRFRYTAILMTIQALLFGIIYLIVYLTADETATNEKILETSISFILCLVPFSFPLHQYIIFPLCQHLAKSKYD